MLRGGRALPAWPHIAERAGASVFLCLTQVAVGEDTGRWGRLSTFLGAQDPVGRPLWGLGRPSAGMSEQDPWPSWSDPADRSRPFRERWGAWPGLTPSVLGRAGRLQASICGSLMKTKP